MKLRCAVLFVLYLSANVLFCSFLVADEAPKFTEREKAKLKLIGEAKKFGETVGLLPTDNFLEFRETVPKYTLLFYSKKTDVPYSYIDPKILATESRYGIATEAALAYGISTETYDIFLAQVATASGTYITRKLLSYGDTTIARIVLHECLHNNINLPRHMEEAAALLFETVAAARFFGEDDKGLRSACAYALVDAVFLDQTFHEIEGMSAELSSGTLSLAEYLEKRDEKIKNSWYETMTEISVHHSYKHYFALFYRWLKGNDLDVKKYVEFLKQFPYKDSDRTLSEEEYFKETLRVEEEAERYLAGIVASFPEEVSDETETASDTNNVASGTGSSGNALNITPFFFNEAGSRYLGR